MPAEENVFLDDCAMRPLKALGEENRRKSAPAFHHVLRDSTEWRVNDNDENLSSRLVSDDASDNSSRNASKPVGHVYELHCTFGTFLRMRINQ